MPDSTTSIQTHEPSDNRGSSYGMCQEAIVRKMQTLHTSQRNRLLETSRLAIYCCDKFFTLSGDAGRVTFFASDALRYIGVKIRFIAVLVTVDEAGKIRYSATFRTASATVAVMGSVDVERLILACSVTPRVC